MRSLCAWLMAALTLPAVAREPAAPRPMVNDFVISSTELDAGVVRAFYYNGKTVIELGGYPLYFSVVDGKGIDLPFSREGKFVRLSGQLKQFTASIDGKKVDFKASVEQPAKIGGMDNPLLVQGQDFSYEITGDAGIAPFQIFDDGKRTFMQFKSGQDVPAIFTSRNGVNSVVSVTPQSPYMVADLTGSEFQFILRGNKAVARYTGKRQVASGASVVPVAASLGSGEKLLQTGSRPSSVTPVAPDKKLEANVALASKPLDKPVEKPAEAIAEVKSVATAEKADKDVAEVPFVQQWKITNADKNVRILLERWSKEAKEARYQIIWEIPRDLELGAIATVSGTFEDALESVLISLVDSEYPIEALMYDNNAVRIVKHIPENK